MIHIIDKANCCGCEACVQICPKKCISLERDKEGFLYPIVNKSICIKCDLCEKVCPELNQYEERPPSEVIAACNKDEECRSASSSGGIFSFLAYRTIEAGGIVFGAKFDNQWQVVIDSAETKDDLAPFRGSKYVQARIGDSYIRCKKYLDDGRQVLFTGTPCHIAGLKHYLRKSYRNLLTCDVICYGVPSPMVWRRYIEESVPSGIENITNIRFRDKRIGWKQFSFTIDYRDGGEIHTLTSPFNQNSYMCSFLGKLILRPSCYSCPAKNGKSHSDITLADYWGVDEVNPQVDDNKGLSLVLIRTEKGREAITTNNLVCTSANYEDVLKYNYSVVLSATPHPRRNKFFKAFARSENVYPLINKCLKRTLLDRMVTLVKDPGRVLRRIIRLFSSEQK